MPNLRITFSPIGTPIPLGHLADRDQLCLRWVIKQSFCGPTTVGLLVPVARYWNWDDSYAFPPRSVRNRYHASASKSSVLESEGRPLASTPPAVLPVCNCHAVPAPSIISGSCHRLRSTFPYESSFE